VDSHANNRQVYLSGRNAQLGGWDPSAVPLRKGSDSLWSTTLTFQDGEEVEYKVTAGSWWTEALDSSESLFNNLRLVVRSDTVVQVKVYDWLNGMSNGIPVIDDKRFRPRRPYFTLDGLWKYRAGDSIHWSDPHFNDSAWVITDPFISWSDSLQASWRDIGWFRFHVFVDSSLWNRTLAIRIHQLGASEIYYNGNLLYRFGKVGTTSATYEPNAMSWWQQIRIDPQYEQLIAVRYANPDWGSQVGMGFAPGFLITLKDVNTAFRTATGVRVNAEVQMVFTLIPLILFFVHLSLYGFLRSQRQNLYYALCMLGFSGLTYFSYARDLVVDVDKLVLLSKLGGVSVSFAILFGLLTVFELNYSALPKRIWAYVSMAAVTGFLLLMDYRFTTVTAWNYIFFAVTTLDGILVSFKKGNVSLRGDWLLLLGFLMLTGFVSFQMLVDYGIAPQTQWTRQSYAYGMVSLALAMSMFLSYNVARVNKDLEVQLNNVRELSDRTIEQERISHKLELERTAIEVENERRSKELESARQLQLSLLPTSVPHVEGLDIACFMRTATEVGGDYYDFINPTPDGVTIAVGDATGHGLKAGHMVTATKGLLNALAGSPDLVAIMTSANRAIKQMNLPMLTMCLAIVRIEKNALTYTSAGMPPLLVYRALTRECELHVLKAMPLGAVAHFPYASTSMSLARGDVAVITSDGVTEMFDVTRDTYGIENVMNSLKLHADKPSSEIVRSLFHDAATWAGKTPLEDDVTLVVIKVVATLGQVQGREHKQL
jgi:serine phosphatase RsbU (regulator of sigma subunit)